MRGRGAPPVDTCDPKKEWRKRNTACANAPAVKIRHSDDNPHWKHRPWVLDKLWSEPPSGEALVSGRMLQLRFTRQLLRAWVPSVRIPVWIGVCRWCWCGHSGFKCISMEMCPEGFPQCLCPDASQRTIPKMKPQWNEDMLDVSSQLPRSRSGEKPWQRRFLVVHRIRWGRELLTRQLSPRHVGFQRAILSQLCDYLPKGMRARSVLGTCIYPAVCVCVLGTLKNALRDLDPQSIRFLRFSDPDGSSASGASGRLRWGPPAPRVGSCWRGWWWEALCVLSLVGRDLVRLGAGCGHTTMAATIRTTGSSKSSTRIVLERLEMDGALRDFPRSPSWFILRGSTRRASLVVWASEKGP